MSRNQPQSGLSTVTCTTWRHVYYGLLLFEGGWRWEGGQKGMEKLWMDIYLEFEPKSSSTAGIILQSAVRYDGFTAPPPPPRGGRRQGTCTAF